jgi:hypothetical protein
MVRITFTDYMQRHAACPPPTDPVSAGGEVYIMQALSGA